MSFTFRPAVRENTPLIIGIAGPTKSGKTYSAHRLAIGLANGGTVAMINAEGPRGHQYADTFKYVACDIAPPFRPTRFTEALTAAAAIKPAVVIIDSASHMHDGPGGLLEWHDEELNRMAGTDQGKRDKSNFAAWVRPKAGENEFIYAMLGMSCPVILCFRAKEKLKIVPGRAPVDLGWQPIAGERIAFETLFTLMLPPHSKGVPDLTISEMREPFDAMVPEKRQIDERLGQALAEWARGGTAPARPTSENGGRLDAKTRDSVVAAFAEYMVTPAQLEAHLGKPSTEWTSADRATLIGIYNALKSRQTTVDQAFGASTEPASQPDLLADAAAPPADPAPLDRDALIGKIQAKLDRMGAKRSAPIMARMGITNLDRADQVVLDELDAELGK